MFRFKKLIDQLAPGGRLIMPLGQHGGNQTLTQIDKLNDGRITYTELLGVLYVPLTNLNYYVKE